MYTRLNCNLISVNKRLYDFIFRSARDKFMQDYSRIWIVKAERKISYQPKNGCRKKLILIFIFCLFCTLLSSCLFFYIYIFIFFFFCSDVHLTWIVKKFNASFNLQFDPQFKSFVTKLFLFWKFKNMLISPILTFWCRHSNG